MQQPQTQPQEGVFLSPYSIAEALAMVLYGVEPGGESYQQLQRVVFGAGDSGNGLSLEDLGTEMQQMHSALIQVGLICAPGLSTDILRWLLGEQVLVFSSPSPPRSAGAICRPDRQQRQQLMAAGGTYVHAGVHKFLGQEGARAVTMS